MTETWPVFTSNALAHGVRSSMSVPLTGDFGVVGALNLYAPRPDVYDEGLTAQTAFEVLRRASHTRNIKIREVAARLIESVTGAPASIRAHFQPRS